MCGRKPTLGVESAVARRMASDQLGPFCQKEAAGQLTRGVVSELEKEWGSQGHGGQADQPPFVMTVIFAPHMGHCPLRAGRPLARVTGWGSSSSRQSRHRMHMLWLGLVLSPLAKGLVRW